MSKEVLKRLESLERKINALAEGKTCCCSRFINSEYDGSWYCDFHGSVFGEWADHKYNIEYWDDES